MLVDKNGKVYFHHIILKEDGTKEVTQDLPEEGTDVKIIIDPLKVIKDLENNQ